MVNELPSSPEDIQQLRAELSELDEKFIESGRNIATMESNLLLLEHSKGKHHPEYERLDQHLSKLRHEHRKLNLRLLDIQKKVYKNP